MLSVHNLFDNNNKTLICKNTLICISDYDWYILILSINCDNLLYNYYSDEWLYLINYNYPHCGYYNEYINRYNNFIQIYNLDHRR